MKQDEISRKLDNLLCWKSLHKFCCSMTNCWLRRLCRNGPIFFTRSGWDTIWMKWAKSTVDSSAIPLRETPFTRFFRFKIPDFSEWIYSQQEKASCQEMGGPILRCVSMGNLWKKGSRFKGSGFNVGISKTNYSLGMIVKIKGMSRKDRLLPEEYAFPFMR